MAITAEELNIILQVRDQQFQKALKADQRRVNNFSSRVRKDTRAVTKSFNSMGRSAGANRAAMQNASFQLQDIFTQISMGTPITRTLSIQLPQLLGGFGALGAAVGVGVGALGMFAPALLDSTDAAGDLEDQLKGLSEAVGALNDAQEMAASSSSDLINQYGNLAPVARELLDIQRQVAEIRAMEALDTATRGMADALGVGGALDFAADNIRDIKGSMEALRAEQDALNASARDLSDTQLRAAIKRGDEIASELADLGTLRRNMDDLADMFGITEDAATEVAAKFAEIGAADGPAQQAQAMIDLASFIKQASGNLSDAEEEGDALYSQLLEAARQALSLSAVDLHSNIGAGADEADRLAGNLERAAIWEAARVQHERSSGRYSGRGGDPRQFDTDGRLGGGFVPSQDIVDRANSMMSGSSGRKGSSGGRARTPRDALSDLVKEVALNEQLLGVSDARAQVMRRLGDDAENYNETEISGVIRRVQAYETEKAALEEIQAQQQNVADTIENEMTSAFMGIIDGTKTAKEAFADMARNVIAELMRVLVVQQMVGSFDSRTGAGSGIVGAIMGGLSGRAGGGSVMAGNAYRVGEHGPEPFVPAQNGRILSVAQAKSAMGQQGPGQTVNQTINVTTGVQQTVRAEIKSLMPQITEAAVAATRADNRRRPT